METPSTVTPAKQSQPVRGRLFYRDPRKGERQESFKDDATLAAFCLNACMGTPAYERLTALHRDLEQFRAETVERRQVRAALDKEIQTPAGAGVERRNELAAHDIRLMGSLDKRHLEISERLARYVFRPGIAYTAVGGECRSGVVALPRRNVAVIRTGSFPITEADAALALVRLHATGDLSKVRPCETCRKRWRVAAHSNYRFCSKRCREQFYESQPDYHERKAKNQRKHRENLKRKHAAEDAALSKGRK